jgi:hypothetical protein
MASSRDTPAQAAGFVALCQELLGSDTVGVYLHGSYVAQGFQPQSDLDLLLVADKPISDSILAQFLERLLNLSARHPTGGSNPRCLDILAVTTHELAAPAYPGHCQFLYGEWLRQGFEAGGALSPFADPVVTLLLAQAWQEAEPVFGPPFQTLARPLPPEHLPWALRDSLPALLADLRGDERNVLLTLARMWRTVAEGDFVSKDAAADWVAARLPAEHATVMLDAGRAYRGEITDDWALRQPEAEATAAYLRDQLVALLGTTP